MNKIPSFFLTLTLFLSRKSPFPGLLKFPNFASTLVLICCCFPLPVATQTGSGNKRARETRTRELWRAWNVTSDIKRVYYQFIPWIDLSPINSIYNKCTTNKTFYVRLLPNSPREISPANCKSHLSPCWCESFLSTRAVLWLDDTNRKLSKCLTKFCRVLPKSAPISLATRSNLN